MKKLISIILALVMALSLCVTTTWADDPAPAAVTPTTPAADYTWYDGVTATEYTIGTKEALLGFANIVNGTDGRAADTFEGKIVKLTADIDLGGMEWTPIAPNIDGDNPQFKGEFNGNGKTVKNFRIDASTKNGGFFGYINYGISVHDLTVSDVTATVGAKLYGTVAADFRGKAKNVTVKNINVTFTTGDGSCGGMFGYYGWATAENCKVIDFEVLSTGGPHAIGGFTARATVGGTGNVCDCKNYINCDVQGVKINATDNESSCTYVGGFIGYCNKRWNHPGYDGCDVSGIDFTVAGNVNAGGFIACPKAAGTAVNCTTQGKIDATGVTSTNNCVGGFFANGSPEWQENNVIWHRMTNCVADVDIVSGGAPAGGFFGVVGGVLSHAVELKNCEAKGDVTNENGVAGGFAGVNRGSTTRASADRAEMPASAGTYTGCVASGTVQGKVAGGFAGEVAIPVDEGLDNNSKLELKGCEVKGTVVGSDAAGGLVGQVIGTKNGDNKLTINVDADTKADSSLVVGTGSTTKTDGMINTDGLDDENTANITVAAPQTSAGTTVVPPAGSQVTTDNGKLNVPAGSQVNGTATEADKVFDMATGQEVVEPTPEPAPAPAPSAPDQAPINRQDTTTTVKDTTTDTTKTDTVTSAKTFDAGVTVYAAMSVMSLTGSAWIVGKKRV